MSGGRITPEPLVREILARRRPRYFRVRDIRERHHQPVRARGMLVHQEVVAIRPMIAIAIAVDFLAHPEDDAEAVILHVLGHITVLVMLLWQDGAVLHVEVAFRERTFRSGLRAAVDGVGFIFATEVIFPGNLNIELALHGSGIVVRAARYFLHITRGVCYVACRVRIFHPEVGHVGNTRVKVVAFRLLVPADFLGVGALDIRQADDVELHLMLHL